MVDYSLKTKANLALVYPRALFSFGGLHDFRRLYAYGLVHFNEAGNLFPSLPIHTSPFVMCFDAAVVHVAVRKSEVEFCSNWP
jgi:hypothetical protein